MGKKQYWVYILKCVNDSYYTGYTTDIIKRYLAHVNGKGAKYTRSFKPVCIAQQWQFTCDKPTIMKIERSIKKLSHQQKSRLIESPTLLSTFCGEWFSPSAECAQIH